MATIFSKIARGEIPSYKVAESEKFYAFLDINPMAKGHTLVIPKEECDYIFDMKSEDVSSLFAFTQIVAKAIKEAIPCKRVAVAVLGLEVPHAHVHLVPINSEGDLDFLKNKLKLDDQEMTYIAKMISDNIKQ